VDDHDPQRLPIRVADPGTRALPVVAEAERGRHLYVAKGCVTCHSHGASGAPSETRSLKVGPDLTDRRLPADYLAKFLADPSIKTAWTSGDRMPDLELAPREIAALVAFVNAERRVSGR
jgi:mono/diheme cytochrome c family protein